MNKFFLTFLFLLSPLTCFSLEPLSVKGKKIVDKQGKKVELRGINLGGWLAEEMWMLPFKTEPPKGVKSKKIVDHVSLWNTFEARFGKEQMQEIRSRFRHAFINKKDFERIKAAGFNCVRLPFLYDLAEEPTGLFFWLDKALDEAKQHGLYVILDMHGTPGRQSDDEHTGEKGKNRLFSDSQMIKKTAKLWKEIAKHYKGKSEIAAFDLINEPKGAKNHDKLYKTYHKIYEAIRTVDKDRIILIEDGYKGISHMPHPKEYKWKNVIFSPHCYDFEAKTDKALAKSLSTFMKKVTTSQKRCNVPYYFGEVNVTPHGTKHALKHFLAEFHKNSHSYSLWTYKIANHGHSKNLWGLYYASNKLSKINPFTDSLREIHKKIERLHTSYFVENLNMREALS